MADEKSNSVQTMQDQREARYGIWAKATIKIVDTRFEVHVNEGLPDADELIIRTDREKAAFLVSSCVASDLLGDDIILPKK